MNHVVLQALSESLGFDALMNHFISTQQEKTKSSQTSPQEVLQISGFHLKVKSAQRRGPRSFDGWTHAWWTPSGSCKLR